MADIFEIPTSPNPQKFVITLSGVQYVLTLQWNFTLQLWMLDIADTNSALIVAGIPLVTGVDLLEPFSYLNFGGSLFASTDSNPDAPPTFDNLGLAGHLYWVSTP